MSNYFFNKKIVYNLFTLSILPLHVHKKTLPKEQAQTPKGSGPKPNPTLF